MKGNTSLPLLFFFLALFIWGSSHLQAQRKININDPAKTINRTKSATEKAQLPAQFMEGVEEYREFYLNPQLKSEASSIQPGDEIVFELLAGRQYTGTVTAVTEYIPGITGITAKLQDYDFAYGYMSISGKGVKISVNIPEINDSFSVDKWENSLYLLKYSQEYIERRASLKCGTPDIHQDEMPVEKETVELEPRIQPRRTKSPAPLYSFDDLGREATIRLMYVYTSTAMERLASLGRDRDNEITLSMLESQLILDNSETGVQLELAQVHEIEYERIGVESILFDAVYNKDTRMNEVYTIRDAEDIDIVVLVTYQTYPVTVTGVAASPATYAGNRDLSFVAIDMDVVSGDYVVIHELGHTVGCNHHLEQTTQPAPSNRLFKYGTAWRGTVGYVPDATVMSYTEAKYNGGKSYKRIPYFSSPDITVNSAVIGNEELSNNALVWKQMKHVAATYGKGMQIDLGKKTISYGLSGNVQATIYRQNFNLRTGDRIVYTREPGDFPGIYATTAYIEDSNGIDVTDDPYYQGNLYIVSGTWEIVPKEVGIPGVQSKLYDGTTNAEISFANLRDSFIGGDDVDVDTSEFSASFSDPDVDVSHNYLKRVYFSGTLRFTGSKASYYELPASYNSSQMVTIRPAPLSIEAKKIEILLGTDPSTVDLSDAYTITGLVNNETESVLSGSLSVSIDPAITSSSPAGVYPGAIKISGYTATNYAITYQTADLEIRDPQQGDASGTATGLVTIGAGEPAATGAILQLKNIYNVTDGGVNATGGLLLPRVALTDLTKLYPMFEPGYDSAQDALHIGLVVFNVKEDTAVGLSVGVYVWNGNKWEKLNLEQ